jgi:glycosyltransferase involved in cell wall biosynthesis
MLAAIDLTLPSRALTGTRVYAESLVEALQSRPEWSVKTLSKPRRMSGRGSVKRLVNGLELCRWLQSDLASALRGIDADILHCPAFVAPFQSPVPVVISFHDRSFFSLPEDPLSGMFLRLLSSLAMRQAAGIITFSHAVHDDVISHYGLDPDRVSVIYHGVSARFSPVPTRADERLNDRFGLKTPYALFVGALSRRKNLMRVLDALAMLRQRGECLDLQLVLAGPSGNYQTHLEQRARALGISGRVRVLGWVSEEYLPALYRGAQMFVFPSLFEGFGLPLLEAMASGVPVITSATTALPEIAGEAAILVDPMDRAAIARAIGTLHEDTALRSRLRDLGLARALDFTWESSAGKTHEAYERAAGVARAAR